MRQIVRVTILMCTVFVHYEYAHNKIFFTSIPKSGTHLMLEALEELTGMHNIGLSTVRKNCGKVDVESLDIADLPDLYQCADQQFIWFHAPWDAIAAKLLRESNIKVIFMYRDPRDQQLSMLNWLRDQHLQEISFAQFSQALVRGHLAWPSNSLINLYHNFLQWSHEPNVYTTTFEKMIGSRGGGDDEIQLGELRNIANFLEITVSDDELRAIAHKMYGKGSTFKFGKIGTWREFYTDEHKTLFKSISGDLLQQLGYEQDDAW
jgi:hypothetical protein